MPRNEVTRHGAAEVGSAIAAATWPAEADGVVGGDQAVVLAYLTPARGVVLLPVSNTGLCDRSAGRVTVTSSIGMWRKLARIQTSPRIALAYHTRAHGFAKGQHYVLLQGSAWIGPLEDRTWIDRHRDHWERFLGPRDVSLWEPLLRAYHWRIPVELEVARAAVWPDLECRAPVRVEGPSVEEPVGQRPPKNGTGPRIDHRKAARRAARLPNVLLGWAGADGFPVVVPVRVAGAADDGIVLHASPGLLPEGGRRAGLLAHSFARYTFGQNLHKHTGWLEVQGDRIVYAPHTERGYHLPSSRFLYRAGAAFVTNRGLRAARRAGFVS